MRNAQLLTHNTQDSKEPWKVLSIQCLCEGNNKLDMIEHQAVSSKTFSKIPQLDMKICCFPSSFDIHVHHVWSLFKKEFRLYHVPLIIFFIPWCIKVVLKQPLHQYKSREITRLIFIFLTLPDSMRQTLCGLPFSTMVTLSLRRALMSQYTCVGSGLDAPWTDKQVKIFSRVSWPSG